MPTKLEGFVEKLKEFGRQRLGISDVWAAFFAVDPEAKYVADQRWRLLSILEEAESAGSIVLPRARLDQEERPHLPKSITVNVVVPRQRTTIVGSQIVWPLGFQWAADLLLQDDQLQTLEQVMDFVRKMPPDEPVVSLQERSLEITGDEKRLGTLLGTQLFGPGRLSPELLRVEQVYPPLAWCEIGPEATLLVIENLATYRTFEKALAPGDGVGLLTYGQGNQFTASVRSIPELPRRIERIVYFGDIDLEGLVIPITAGTVAERMTLPKIEPASELYRSLMRTGRRGTGSVVSEEDAGNAAAWLPADLRDEVYRMLTHGERLAQEGLGFKQLKILTRATA